MQYPHPVCKKNW